MIAALLLLSVVAVPRITAQDFNDQSKTWPCPDADVLAPCTCYADSQLSLYLDCQRVADLDTLTRVFDNNFSFKKFARLQISDSDLEGETLTDDVFKDFSFREVIIFDNKISAVDPDTFQNSKKELTFFEYIDSATGPAFPLPMDMSDYVDLREIVVSSACTEIPNLASPTLRSLTIRCSHPVSLSGVTMDLPSLTTLHLHNSHLTTVDGGDFSSSPDLMTVTMNNNDITGGNTIILTFQNLITLDLSSNNLDDMPDITGMSERSILRIHNNSNIKKLTETNTKRLLDSGVEIETDGVILKCDCDLLWLLGDDTSTMYLNNRLQVTTDCGEEGETIDWDDIREILTTLCP